MFFLGEQKQKVIHIPQGWHNGIHIPQSSYFG